MKMDHGTQLSEGSWFDGVRVGDGGARDALNDLALFEINREIRDQLIDLYLSVKIRSNMELNKLNKEIVEKEKNELIEQNITSYSLI